MKVKDRLENNFSDWTILLSESWTYIRVIFNIYESMLFGITIGSALVNLLTVLYVRTLHCIADEKSTICYNFSAKLGFVFDSIVMISLNQHLLCNNIKR